MKAQIHKNLLYNLLVYSMAALVLLTGCVDNRTPRPVIMDDESTTMSEKNAMPEDTVSSSASVPMSEATQSVAETAADSFGVRFVDQFEPVGKYRLCMTTIASFDAANKLFTVNQFYTDNEIQSPYSYVKASNLLKINVGEDNEATFEVSFIYPGIYLCKDTDISRGEDFYLLGEADATFEDGADWIYTGASAVMFDLEFSGTGTTGRFYSSRSGGMDDEDVVFTYEYDSATQELTLDIPIQDEPIVLQMQESNGFAFGRVIKVGDSPLSDEDLRHNLVVFIPLQ